MTNAFSESSNISEKDYDVILGHHHISLYCRTIQSTIQLWAILRFF